MIPLCHVVAFALALSSGGTGKANVRSRPSSEPIPTAASAKEASAPAPVSPRPSRRNTLSGPLWVGALIGPGINFNGGPVALELSVRGAIELDFLGENLPFQLLLPLTLLHASSSTMGITATTFGLSFVPAGRLLVPVHPRVRAYGEAGLGLGLHRTTVPVTFLGEVSGTAATLELGLAAGVELALKENVAIFFEPLGLRISTGGGASMTVGNVTQTVQLGSGAQWTVFLGAAFKLPR